jgi:hypothetical protein
VTPFWESGAMSDQEANKLYFMLYEHLLGYCFNPLRPEGIKFAAAEPSEINVSITPSDAGCFNRSLVCSAYWNVTVPPELRDFVANLVERKFQQYTGSPLVLPYVERDEEQIDKDGNIRSGYGVKFEHYPVALQEICDQNRATLQDKVERFVKLLRWQQEIDGPHVLSSGRGALYWNVNPNNYWAVAPGKQSSGGRSPAGITWDETDQSDFADLWSSGTNEPLAHELLREAFEASDLAPRSALLMAASALETGIKTHIAKLVPDAEWLLLEAPSPPIYKMFRTYLFELHQSRGLSVANSDTWKDLFKCVQSIMEYRNKLTHTGAMPANVTSELPELLAQTRDILYILDVLEGPDWAKNNVRNKIATKLGWPQSRRHRMFFTVSS